MTSKALKSQLLAAVAMVLVAAIALGGSTFAWFANNNKVTAQGFSVNAAVDDSLVIKGTDGGEVFGSVGTSTLSITNMKPTTSNDGVHFGKLGSTVKVENTGASNATWTGEGGVFATGNIVDAANDAGNSVYYYAESTYTIKAVGSDASIYASAVNVSDAAEIFKAVRVSVTITDNTSATITKVYNPAGANTDSKVGVYGANWTLGSDSSVYTGTTNAAIWSLTHDTEYTVTIRVWFEGQDVDCFTDQVETTGTNVSVDFSKYVA